MKQPLRIVHARASGPAKTGRQGVQVSATVTAATAAPHDSSEAIASTAFVTSAITSAGADYQPADADLTAIAALTTTSFGRGVLSQADAAAARGYLGAQAAGSYQAADATLTALAGVSTAADQLVYAAGPDAFAATGFTAAGRALVDDASAAAQRVTLGLESVTYHGDSDYLIQPADRMVILSASPTAQRTWTLPPAASLNPGQPLTVLVATSVMNFPLVIACQGADALNNSTSLSITTPRAVMTFYSNGLATWSTDARIKAAGTTASTFAAGNDDRITGALQAGNNLSDLANLTQSRSHLDVYSTTQATSAITAAITAAAPGFQPADADLTAIAALATTGYGRGVLSQADAAGARSYLGAQAAGSYQPLDSDLTAIAAVATTTFGRGVLALADGPAALGYIGAQAAGSYQPLDSDLTAIAALTTTTYGRGVLSQADAATARGYLGAQAAGGYQPLDPTLTGLAATGPTADQLLYATAPDTFAATPVTAQGRALIDDATAAAQRVTMGVDQWTSVGDADYAIAAADRAVATTTAFTAPRTWTLPAANAVNPGHRLLIVDRASAVSGTNTITLARVGTDTVNGGASIVLTRPLRSVELVCDGVGKWTFDSQSRLLDTTNIFTAPQTTAVVGGGANAFQVQSEGNAVAVVQRSSTDSVAPAFNCLKTRGSIASPAAVVMNDVLGQLGFFGNDGTASRAGANFQARVIAPTPSSTDMQTRVALNVCAAGSGTPTELAKWEHATGFSLYGTQVLSARQTGFAAATGIGAKGSYATYTTGTAATSYSQSEAQAVRDHLQVVSQQLKALKDALLTHGLIGA